jgi:DNA-binding SARP family transcriptional activator
MQPPIRITMLGRFAVHFGSHDLMDQVPHKAQELLAYLVLHRGKAHPREALAELLWGERDTPNSRKYLRQALWQLHSGLLPLGRARAAQVLHAQSDWLELTFDDRATTDLVDFESSFDEVRGTAGTELTEAQARAIVAGAQLYGRDLLDGWPAEWCTYERDRYRRMYLSMLDRLADYFESRHEYDTVVAYATLALRYEPARERCHRSTMRALAKAGDRGAALRQYERCVRALDAELGLEPEPETVVLEGMIRAGQVLGAVRERADTNGSARSKMLAPVDHRLSVLRPRPRAATASRR